MGRPKQLRQLEVAGVLQEEGFAPPSLRIGGVELTASGGYRSPGRGRQQSNQQQHADQEEQDLVGDDEALALADYLENVLNGSNSEGSADQQHGQHAFVRAAGREVGEVDEATLDQAYALSSSGSDSSSSSDSSSESDEDGNIEDGQQHAAFMASSHEHVQESTRSGHGVKQHSSEQFPFIMRAATDDGHRKPKGGSKAKQRSVAKGAFGGTLLPGEKKKLKKEQKEAKRAAREARRGFDVESLAQQLHEFMVSQGDMLVLNACGKHAQEVAVRLLRMAGLKASVQGSGKRQVVVGSWPQHATPSAMTKQVAAKVRAAVDAEIAAQRKGAAAGAGVGPAGSAMTTAMAEARATHNHRTPRDSGRAQATDISARPAAAGQRQPSQQSYTARWPSGFRPQSRYQVPVRFVRGDTVVDIGAADAVMIFPPWEQASTLQQSAASGPIVDAAIPTETGDKAHQQKAPGEAQTAAGRPADDAGATERGDTTGVLPANRQDREDGSLDIGSHDISQQQQQQQQQQQEAAQPQVHSAAVTELHAASDAAISAAQSIMSLWEQMERRFAAPLQVYDTKEHAEHQQQQQLRQMQHEHASQGQQPTHDDHGQLQSSDSMDACRDEAAASDGSGGMKQTAFEEGTDDVEQGDGDMGNGVGAGVEGASDEELHVGLGYEVGSEGHMYQLSGVGLGLGLDGPADVGYHEHMMAEVLAHEPQLQLPQHAVRGGGSNSGKQGSRRRGRRAVHTYVMDAVLGTGSPGLGTDRVMRRTHQYDPAQADVFLEAEFDISVNRTKQQSKAASKKAAKLARRGAGAAAGPSGGLQHAGLGSIPQVSMLHLTFAGFEKHTTGIGSQLMRRWGWSEGSGLGRSQQGRAVPVMAHKRPKNLGLGALPEELQSNAAGTS